jgi:hypothetical protein
MKSLLGVFAMVAVFSMGAVGCGDDSGDVDMTVIDMSASGTTCSVIATCILGAGGDVPTIMACVAKGSTKAQGLYTALQTCGITHCTMATDAGAAKCSSPTDPSAGCVSCATAAAQSAVCSTQLGACFADK